MSNFTDPAIGLQKGDFNGGGDGGPKKWGGGDGWPKNWGGGDGRPKAARNRTPRRVFLAPSLSFATEHVQ